MFSGFINKLWGSKNEMKLPDDKKKSVSIRMVLEEK